MPDDFTTPPQQTPQLPYTAPSPPPGYGYAAAPALPEGQYASPDGPVGKIRPTGISILLVIVTLGIYLLVYYFLVQDEMKRHSGQGLGGVLALVIAIFAGIISPFVLSNEVGGLYERAGRPAPVSALTGLWYFPGMFILVGPIVWFVKTNAALNDYWRSVGAR
jgi:hypothetical protein